MDATSHMPDGAGSATPERDNARGQAGEVEGQRIADAADCARAEARRKADATLIARAALAGVELVKLADGTWIASRWGMFKPLAEAEVQAWLARIGAPA
jgi:hypothetical protein